MTFTTDHFELGMYGANSTGLSLSRAPERWTPTWDKNRALALLADEAGLDFHLPLSRWMGMGGESNPLFATMDPMTWAGGLAAVTRRITLFATIHTSYFHPIVAAKQLATLDHISGGRVGLNIVSGWHPHEFDMFGLELYEHDLRYEFSKEWVEIVTGLWSRPEPFDYHGRFFTLSNAISDPKPQRGRLRLMNAGASRAGRRFATSHCDSLFIVMASPEQGGAEVAAANQAARDNGRSVDVYTVGYVVCRPTRKEAQEYHDYVALEMADHGAIDNAMELLGLNSQSFSPEHYQLYRVRFGGGHGNYPIVGNPDDVAMEIKRIRDAGFRGMGFGLIDYLEEFPYFRDEVLPRLEALGVRRPER